MNYRMTITTSIDGRDLSETHIETTRLAHLEIISRHVSEALAAAQLIIEERAGAPVDAGTDSFHEDYLGETPLPIRTRPSGRPSPAPEEFAAPILAPNRPWSRRQS